MFVAQRDADAIDFGLDEVLDRGAIQATAHVLVEAPQVIGAVGVVEAEHRDGVGSGREPIQGFAADALAGRVRGHQVGELTLEGLKLGVEGIVLLVAKHRGSVHVVQAVVPPDLVPQAGDALASTVAVHRAPRR